MAFETVADLDCEVTIQLGGTNKESGKPNPKTIEGYFLGSKMTEGKYGPSYLHIFKTPKGNVGVWGKTDLDAKLGGVKAGTMVKATFDKTVPSNKGNDKWKYVVQFDKANSIEVASDDNSSGNEETAFGSDEPVEESGFGEETQAEESFAPPPRKPSTQAKPNAARATGLLGTRK